MDSFIHETACVRNSRITSVKLFRNAVVNDSELQAGCSIGDDTTVERCSFENNVLINRRSYINDSKIGRYTYTGINTTMNWTKIGRFCSLARNVDIGGADHDYKKITTMPAFRFEQMRMGGGKLLNHQIYDGSYCQIGNDVWIAAGAVVLHKAKIGDGAVIGSGAVVTRDIPPYAIAVGVPARVVGYRCNENQIKRLLSIQWWNWPEDTIMTVMDDLINCDISDEMLDKMQSIAESINRM